MKKFFSIILSIVMIISILPIGAITVSAATSGTTGDCTWQLNGTKLTISGNGDMGKFDYNNASPWGTNVTSLVIENGVTSIGSFAFYNCTLLTNITIPNSVAFIGAHAFAWCNSLTSVEIPDSVNSIWAYAFYACTSLKNIKISNSLTSIAPYTFSDCYSLEKVTIPGGVKRICDYAFHASARLRA